MNQKDRHALTDTAHRRFIVVCILAGMQIVATTILGIVAIAYGKDGVITAAVCGAASTVMLGILGVVSNRHRASETGQPDKRGGDNNAR